MGNSLINIKIGAFAGCRSLESIIIPNSTTIIDTRAFEACTNLKKVVLGSSVEEIGINAFNGCDSLSEINLPNSLKYIDNVAFSGCKNLTSITIPNSVIYMGWGIFQYCEKLESCTILASIKTLSEYTFSNCSALKDVTLSNSITRIIYYAFENCKELENVSLPSSLTYLDDAVFYGCSKLPKIVLPNTLKYLGASAFAKCSSLEEIVIPPSIDKVQNYTFSSCTSLKNVSLPNGLRTIGSNAFYYCKSLTQIVLPDRLDSIMGSSFEKCTKLLAIEIPNSVSFIGSKAFWSTSLKDIYVNSIQPSDYNCATDAFASSTTASIYKNCKLHYPSSARTAYLATEPWNNFLANDPDEPKPVIATKLNVHPVDIIYIIHNKQTRFTNHLNAVLTPNDVDKKQVKWESTNPAIASIVETGDMECTIQSGTGNSKRFNHGAIRATTLDGSNLMDSCRIVMYWSPQNGDEGDISLDPIKLEIVPEEIEPIYVGSTINLEAKFNDSELNEWGIMEGHVKLKWESFDENVVTVGSTGIVKAIAPGTTQVRVIATLDLSEQSEGNIIISDDEQSEVWEAVCTINVLNRKGVTICVPDVNITDNGSAEMIVNMATELNNLTHYKMDLYLPEGVTLQSYTYNTDRHHGGNLGIHKLSDDSVRIYYIILGQQNPITGTSGELLRLTLDVAPTVTTSLQGSITHISFYDKDNNSDMSDDVTFNLILPTPAYIKGDVNGDGDVDIADAVCIVNHVVGKPITTFNEAAADVNGDGDIDIADAVKIVNLVVGKIDALSRPAKEVKDEKEP